ncbi:dihydrofolate reductase [Alcanivorax sp. P2S70]|uniref:Dihydrofolate reductase n=1 Tax=Alcanivorax profundi TaxID=2338368 RepID=A0A418XUT8_9GAMM|nr:MULTISPECIES: dihydrofolate reductase [Alcanivorax]ERP91772.1 dihydrofolate reductase [Alcanivorax sp. P2S70]RJG16465.1 dihydrofolate reductase [Alcanivorax profundi]
MSIRLSMMVAKASNNVIGRDNKLPWYLPNDLKYFKQVTFGKPVIMGRKTWESLKGPLPGRTNIVITRQPDYLADGAKVVASLDDAVAMAENVAFIEGQEEAVIMGGAEIYSLALPQADRLYLTEVHANVEGDTFFPEYDASEWQQIAREDFVAEGPNPYDYSFVVYERQ